MLRTLAAKKIAVISSFLVPGKNSPNHLNELQLIYHYFTPAIEQRMQKITHFFLNPKDENVAIEKFKQLCYACASDFDELAHKWHVKASPLILRYLARAASRFQDMGDRLEKGIAIEEVVAPYLMANDYAYEDAELFFARDNEIKELFIQRMIKSYHRLATGYLENFTFQSHQDALEEMLSQNTCHVALAQLLVKLVQYPPFNTPDNATQLFISIPESHWPALIDASLIDEVNFHRLRSLHLMEPLLATLGSQHYTGDILLTLAKHFKPCKTFANSKSFFDFLDTLYFNERNHLCLETAELSSKDYFRALLMCGFDYKLCLTGVINHFDELRRQAGLIIYAALLRGDRDSAGKLIKLFPQPQIMTPGTTLLNALGLQSPPPQRSTTLNNEMFYSFAGLCKYMQESYQLSDRKEALYFVKHLEEFATMLYDLNIITDTKGFISKARKEFNPQSSKNVALPDTTLTNSELLSRVQVLEAANTKLENRLADLEKKLAEFSNANNTIIRKCHG